MKKVKKQVFSKPMKKNAKAVRNTARRKMKKVVVSTNIGGNNKKQ